MPPGEIIDHRRQPHSDRDPNLHAHCFYRNDAVRTGASLTCSLVSGEVVAPGFAATVLTPGFFVIFGARIMSGARNPVCSANSASAFPDGKRQLIGSIHSIGRWGILTLLLLRPAPVLRRLGLSGFIF